MDEAEQIPPPGKAAAPDATLPRAVVIVTGYGVAHLLGEALASLQAQVFDNWECVIIDDGAPDDVAGAAAPFLTDSRFRFLATDNRGVSGARNRAIRESRAPLIALLDGDDMLRPEYLATMVPLLESDPAIRLATCNARIFGAVPRERTCAGRLQRDGAVRGSLAQVLDRSFNVYIGSTFRREDFERIGGFDETLTHAEDFDLWVRLMQLGGEAQYVDAVLGDYRIRYNSASAQSQNMLMGGLKVYEKARAALPDGRDEALLIDRLIADARSELAFEHAIDQVIDGHAREGIRQLRALRRNVGIGGPVWTIAFAVWHVFPFLARAMLLWRRRAHRRGADGGGLLAAVTTRRS